MHLFSYFAFVKIKAYLVESDTIAALLTEKESNLLYWREFCSQENKRPFLPSSFFY